jgi:DNA-binding transcriptional regulator YdaS (Cro superfamily)
MTAHDALREALLYYGKGELRHGWRRMADRLGITPQAVRQWRHGVPVHHCRKVAKDTRMTLKTLRPDLFGRP